MLMNKQDQHFLNFHSHIEAKNYFHNRYDNHFVVIYSSCKQNHKMSFCYLLTGDGQAQSIVIFENGKVLFIYENEAESSSA